MDKPIKQSEYLMNNKRPAARDGHTGVCINQINESQQFMLIFGGDRH